MVAASTPLNLLPRYVYLVLAASYMGGIYFLSSLTISFEGTPYPHFLSFLGNLFHYPLYGGLAMLLLLGLRCKAPGEGGIFRSGSVASALSILLLYGIFDEYHQSWSGRNASVIDVLVDALAGPCALLILRTFLEGSYRIGTFLWLFSLFTLAACALALAATLL